MTNEKLQDILKKHLAWLNDKSYGVRANLSGAFLGDKDLSKVNLSKADLSGAFLSGTDLSGADLSRADLSKTELSGTNLSGADLSGTCLDETLTKHSRMFVKQSPPVGSHGGRIVYRTYRSLYVGSTLYKPGHTYVAPNLSWDVATACHPGIYAASLEWMEKYYRNVSLVKCYVRDGEWTITAKGSIRCKRIRVLDFVG